jgi:hypothetical protein
MHPAGRILRGILVIAGLPWLIRWGSADGARVEPREEVTITNPRFPTSTAAAVETGGALAASNAVVAAAQHHAAAGAALATVYPAAPTPRHTAAQPPDAPNWMATDAATVYPRTLRQLTLPGSHDSGRGLHSSTSQLNLTLCMV